MLRRLGIRALVRLADIQEADVTPEQVRAAGLDDCHEPVADMTAPCQCQISRVLKFIDDALGEERPVAISCWAGRGRTGTLLCCYLVGRGQTAEEAISSVRSRGRSPYETKQQLDAIQEFELRSGTAQADS